MPGVEPRGTVFEMVRHHAELRPDAPALTGDGKEWSYGELCDASERLAGGLVAMGVRRGDTLAVVAGNHPTTCLMWLAGARSGIVPSIVNSTLTAPELATILGDLAPRVVVADTEHAQVTREALARTELDAQVVVRADGAAPAEDDFDALLDGDPIRDDEPTADDVVEISYTSGTTSRPKGVLLTHRAVLRRAAQEQALFGLGTDEAALCVTPLFHQSGIRNTVLLMWHCGGKAAIAPRFSVSSYWPDVVEAGATFACFVETILVLLDRQEPSPAEQRHRIRIALGAAPPDVVERVEARFGFRLVQCYGMTENGVAAAVPPTVPSDLLPRYRAWTTGANVAGWPLSGNEIRVVRDGQDVAPGEQGEIWVRSPGLFRGYHRRPDATATAVVDRWQHTGDLGVLGPDGCLYFVDRLTDVIRRGGENVAPKEVEEVLGAHPDVAEAVVIPVPDPIRVQEIKAIVIREPGRPVTAEDLWKWCAPRLASYKTPRYIEFRQSVPRSASGKVQRAVLRAQAAEPDATAGGEPATTFDRMRR